MKWFHRLVLVLAIGVMSPAVPLAAARQTPTEQQGEFVPAESLPQQERMPAAPLLIAAYAVVLLALFVYVLSVARRLGNVKADIARLEGEIKRGSRA